MKLFLFTFLAVAFNCMAQNGIALYGLEYTADTPNARMQGIANEMGNMQLELKFNNDRSFSKILKSIPKDIHSYNVAKIIVGADEPYQQQDNQSITIRNFQNEKF